MIEEIDVEKIKISVHKGLIRGLLADDDFIEQLKARLSE